MNNKHIPQPMFMSASQFAGGGGGGGGDDFDFNEVFAEYFVNEWEDPLNAYTGGMANYNVHVPMPDVDPSGVKRGQSMVGGGGVLNSIGLPTGGIRTAFHAASPVEIAHAPQQPGGSAKKSRTEDVVTSSSALQHLNISGLNQSFGAASAALLQQQQQQQQQQFSLPVGVGIRLGQAIAQQQQQQQQQQILQQQLQQQQSQIPGLQYTQLINAAAGTGTNNSETLWSILQQQQPIDAEGGNEQAIAGRRERNREHAKRSRVRKKFILESLQEQVRQLQRENNSLRLLVQEHIPENAMQIFDECCTKNPLFDASSELNDYNAGTSPSTSMAASASELVRADFSLIQCLTSGQKCFVLSDPKLPDNPIVFATQGFYDLTGYTQKEVLGRNCRFLQGPATDRRSVDVIRKAVATGSDATVCLLNYKADGTPFWNQLFIAALRDSDNCIVNYVGVQAEIEPESAMPSYLEDKVNQVLPLQSKDDDMEEDEV